jgi:predicted secreted protein
MKMFGRLLVPGVCLLPCMVGVAHAGEDGEQKYNQVHIQAMRSQTVSNDRMQVVMTAYREGDDPAVLAGQINQDMDWALDVLRTHEGIKVTSGMYQTFPLHYKGTLKGWRASQDVHLEGRDVSVLSEIVGRLQERLQVKSMEFSVSDARQAEVENGLIEQVLDAFKQRAAIVQANLKASGYRFVSLDVQTAGRVQPRPVFARMQTATMEAEQPVAVAAGESTVSVSVSGTIELQFQ